MKTIICWKKEKTMWKKEEAIESTPLCSLEPTLSIVNLKPLLFLQMLAIRAEERTGECSGKRGIKQKQTLKITAGPCNHASHCLKYCWMVHSAAPGYMLLWLLNLYNFKQTRSHHINIVLNGHFAYQHKSFRQRCGKNVWESTERAAWTRSIPAPVLLSHHTGLRLTAPDHELWPTARQQTTGSTSIPHLRAFFSQDQ